LDAGAAPASAPADANSGSGSVLNLVAPLVGSSSGVSLINNTYPPSLHENYSLTTCVSIKFTSVTLCAYLVQSVSAGSSGATSGTGDVSKTDGSGPDLAGPNGAAGGSSFSSILSLLGPLFGSSSGSGVSF